MIFNPLCLCGIMYMQSYSAPFISCAICSWWKNYWSK